jgi:molybdenum cofactor cytidylyltransferase
MRRPKLLLPWHGGRTIIEDVVDRARAAVSNVIVVTGHHATATAAALRDHDVQIIHNADYGAGEMISSVKAGCAALPPACEAFFLVLGDQPGIAATTFARLIDAWRANPTARIISPTWNNRRGHPVLFSAAGIGEILALPADATLKTYVTRHANDSIKVDVDDPAVCADVDTPEQYVRRINEDAGARLVSPSAAGTPGDTSVAPTWSFSCRNEATIAAD